MKPCTVDSVLLAALEQFEYQATNRPLLAALEKYEDSGTTQKEDVNKRPTKMLHVPFEMWKLKIKIEYQWLVFQII